MTALVLHKLHAARNARFGELNGAELVRDYGEPKAEYAALRERVGVLDLSFRGRLALTGEDRQRFLHGQVTNNIMDLDPGEGCYAVLVNAKGRMVSDLNVYCLPEELLLDCEPGLSASVSARLQQYIIADLVDVVEVASAYGLLSVQGPQAGALVQSLKLGFDLPTQLLTITRAEHAMFGEIYCANQPRGLALGYDLFVPTAALAGLAGQLLAGAQALGGRACGWEALEMVRIEAGIPRFGADMDETNLPPEAGIEQRAVSYTKGCYIGQEVIARIRTYGQVAKALRGLRLADDLKVMPQRGDKLFLGSKEVGAITSALASPALQANIALGYVRREHNEIGTELKLKTAAGDTRATIVPCPFSRD